MSAHEIELAKRCMQTFGAGCVASLELAATAERIGDHAGAARYRASAETASEAAFLESATLQALTAAGGAA